MQENQADQGIAQIQQGLNFWQATGAKLAQSYFLSMLVEAYGQVGQYTEGLQVVDAALTMRDKYGERFWEAELYRLQGELRLAQAGNGPKVEEAEASLQQALDVSRCLQAKTLELRAATSLARLWQFQGKRDTAHTLLAEVYGWFTEGFDTADLQEARMLLDDLQEMSSPVQKV